MAYNGAGHRISMTLLRKICDGAGSVKAAYDYRAFGEQVTLSEPTDKVTETFTGIRLRSECCEHACMFIAEPMGLGAKRKERDDETELNYFGARYLDPMLGLWTSVDPARQFSSPYLYVGNGMNPVNGVDPDGNEINVYSIGFRISAGIGLSLGLGYVRNTENPNDCGIMFSFGLGVGTEVGVLPNTVSSTLMQGGANSLLDKTSVQKSS